MINQKLLQACKALLEMSGGPEGTNIPGGNVDPRTVRQQAVAAITEAEQILACDLGERE